ncbi:MAG: serine/threonine-protein kinase, partial [Gemmatimonadales bacterium]
HFVGEGEGLVYYVMPYVEGHSLGQLLRGSGALSPKRALDVAIPVLRALQHAHERGLIHRDIKPDNIMIDITTGRPLLMDFGIAKRLDANGGLTQTGFVVGTPYYMSPEQALGQGDLDARSDIYSFGAVLFQMVTGTPPFDGESSQEIVGKHLAETPPAPNDVNEEVPSWLSQVIIRCLQKKPVERFQSAKAVIEALEAGQDTEVLEAPAASPSVGGVDPGAETEVVDATVPIAVASGGSGLWRRLAFTGVPLIAVGILAVWWLTRPRLVFENPLAAPVTVSVGSDQHLVEPRGNLTVRLRGGGQTDVMWAVERPTNADGRPMGIEVFGVIALADARGRVEGAAHATPGDRAYFAPLITNETDVPLTVVVNASTPHEKSCDCTVPPGSRRMLIGYYPLFSNSTVRAVDESGRSATFTDFVHEVDRHSGVVGLRFGQGDLR